MTLTQLWPPSSVRRRPRHFGEALQGRVPSTQPSSGDTKVTDSTDSAPAAEPAGTVQAGEGLGVGSGVDVQRGVGVERAALWVATGLGVPLLLRLAGVAEQPSSSQPLVAAANPTATNRTAGRGTTDRLPPWASPAGAAPA